MYNLAYGKIGDKIYRRQPWAGGITLVEMNLYRPFNPRTEKQQALRYLFAKGMRAWQCLSNQEKKRYRGAVEKLPLLGHNLFLKFFLETSLRERDLLLVANWQRELEMKAFKWALERTSELELVSVPRRI